VGARALSTNGVLGARWREKASHSASALVPTAALDRWACVLVFAALFASGCQPSIGDSCTLSTDCSKTGARLCDTSQPEGYCTIFNCTAQGCPAEALCVEFGPSIPGCLYDDRHGPSRVARSMCLFRCDTDSDCRDGYVCRAPSDPQYGARVLDNDKSLKACVVVPIASGIQASTGTTPPPVCGYGGPDVPAIDASTAPPRTDGGDGGAPGTDAGDAATD
jgi:hypothetical protein